MPGGRRPLVRKSTGDFTCGGATAEVNREQDLPARRVRQRGDDGIQGSQHIGSVECQTGSTSQIVSSSRTGPIGPGHLQRLVSAGPERVSHQGHELALVLRDVSLEQLSWLFTVAVA